MIFNFPSEQIILKEVFSFSQFFKGANECRRKKKNCVYLSFMIIELNHFSGLTAIATYFLTKELWTPGAGLFAACFIAISPGYTSRSVAGSYDNEGIAIFALQVYICFAQVF